jgi:hypothetical protein
MRATERSAITAIAVVCVIGSATAAEMTGTEIKDFVSGKSVYLELTATSSGGAGQGVIYYATDGTALYKTATGVTWHGTWAIKGNAACTDWKERPNNPCTKYDKQGDAITILNAETGQLRGKVLKTAAGNAEKITP